MSKKKGFTLVEVIVSIALLGLVAVGFLSVFNNNLNFLKINRDMTTSAFADQQDMELKILETKMDIKDGVILDTSLTTIEDVFESGIDVKAYQLKVSNNNKDIYTLITDTRLPEYKVPIAENVVATLRKGTTEVAHAYAESGTNIIGSSSIDPSTLDVFMVNSYAWYASRPGFNIPVPHEPVPEIEIGNKYPKFPEDYSLIPTSTTITLNDVRDYPGRHIVFAVTPAAKSGRMGKTVPSNPVFISGLPQINSANIFLHLDASTINDTESSEVSEDGSDLLVQKWNDLSPHGKNAIQDTQSSSPKLKEHPVGGDFVGKFVDFDASTLITARHDNLSNANLYVFAVVRGNDSSIFYTNGGNTITASGESIGGSGDPWKIVTLDHSTSNRDFTLGNSDVDVAELIIFRGPNFLTEDREAVMKYLREKYIPLATVGNIIQLRPMTDIEILRNSTYTLPAAVLAEMEYGSDRFVPVTWDQPVNIDTSNLGTFTFTATALNDNTKTTTLNVIVKDPVLVTHVNLNADNYGINVGGSFKLDATVYPLDATNKAITWESSNTSVATVSSDGLVTGISKGNAIITVRTADGDYTATCDVEVISTSIWPDSIILHLDASKEDSISSSSNNISQWRDLSGHNNHFSQGTADRRPTIVNNVLNGKPVVRFDGSNDSLSTSEHHLNILPTGTQDFFLNNTNEFSIFMISKADPHSDNGTFFSKSGGWGNQATFTFGRSSNGLFRHVIRGESTNNVVADDHFNLHTSIHYSGAGSSYWLNGSSKDNSIRGTRNLNQPQEVTLGAAQGGGNNYLRGEIAEVMVFNEALSEVDRKAVETYLIDKWRIPAIEWNFNVATNGTDGWHTPQNINNFGREYDDSISSGVITGNILNEDPYFHSPSNLNIDTNQVSKIVIRLRNNTSSNMGQIYFITTDETTYHEDRHKDFTLIPNSGYIEYEIDMSSLSTWTGTLDAFRIDPAVNALGSFSIEYIKLYKQ